MVGLVLGLGRRHGRGFGIFACSYGCGFLRDRVVRRGGRDHRFDGRDVRRGGWDHRFDGRDVDVREYESATVAVGVGRAVREGGSQWLRRRERVVVMVGEAEVE